MLALNQLTEHGNSKRLLRLKHRVNIFEWFYFILFSLKHLKKDTVHINKRCVAPASIEGSEQGFRERIKLTFLNNFCPFLDLKSRINID